MRFAFSLSGTFRFADRHHQFGLLARKFTPSGLPAAFADLSEILAYLPGESESFGRHPVIVTGL
jgi:hypothetical protein